MSSGDSEGCVLGHGATCTRAHSRCMQFATVRGIDIEYANT